MSGYDNEHLSKSLSMYDEGFVVAGILLTIVIGATVALARVFS